MKLAVLILASMMALSGVAAADDGPMDPYADAGPRRPPRAQRGPGARGVRGQRGQRGARLQQMMLRRFDHNHDGRLGPRERRQAIRALRRLEHQLGRNDQRGARARRFLGRYDLDHDGNIGPGEMPPAVADELRPLDRDGDGWLEGDELP